MPEEGAITFEFIRAIQREELAEPKLSKLPDNFYEKVQKYLQQKRKLAEKKRDRTSSVEANNIERLLEDIFNRRESKIIQHAILTARTDIPPQNLTNDEKDFFEYIVDALKKRREKALSLLFEKTKEKEGYKTLEFKEDIEEFAGIDLKKYGPFKVGDIAEIPNDNAELLIKVGKAEAV